jgi:hypothetical protein
MTALSSLVGVVVVASFATADAEPGWPIFVEDRPAPADPKDSGTERYLELGPVLEPGWAGVRAQLDLISLGGVSVGVAGTLLGNGWHSDAGVHASAVGYLAYVGTLTDRFRLRGQLGFGAAYDADWDASRAMVVTTTPDLVEASLALVVRGNHDWSAVAGPVVQRRETGDTVTLMYFAISRRF